MEANRRQNLIADYLSGRINEKDKEDLLIWYKQKSFEDSVYPDDESVVCERILTKILKSVDQQQKKSTIYSFKKWLWHAAAILLIASAGLAYYSLSYEGEVGTIEQTAFANSNITPGSHQAILVLEDGEELILNRDQEEIIMQGQLLYGDGSTVIADASRNIGKRITLRIPKGGHFQTTLSDGTKVWLNAESEIEFPTSFLGLENRVVKLKGEGYFEVFSDKKQPFYVESDEHRVLATGTAFNISAYPNDKNYKVTLLEGGVNIMDKSIVKEYLLPNQQYIYNTITRNFRKQEVESKHSIDWVHGKFSLNRDELRDIALKIERWYDVEVELEGQDIPNYRFSGTISRSISIMEFLEFLRMTNELNYEIKDRNIKLSPKNKKLTN